MDQRIRLLTDDAVWRRDDVARIVARIALRYIDVLVVPWILDAKVLFAYLFARILSLFVPLLLSLLGRKALPQLVELAQSRQDDAFRAAAARVNLGYLMVCGSAGLLVLLAAPHLAVVLGVSSPILKDLVIWLVIGQSAPIVFGATFLLLHAVGRRLIYDFLSCVTSVFFLITLFAWSGNDGVLVTQTFAAAQLTHACLCALLLTQFGVWPGLTALLYKEIRLF